MQLEIVRSYEKLVKKRKKDYDFVTHKLQGIERRSGLRGASSQDSEDKELLMV